MTEENREQQNEEQEEQQTQKQAQDQAQNQQAKEQTQYPQSRPNPLDPRSWYYRDDLGEKTFYEDMVKIGLFAIYPTLERWMALQIFYFEMLGMEVLEVRPFYRREIPTETEGGITGWEKKFEFYSPEQLKEAGSQDFLMWMRQRFREISEEAEKIEGLQDLSREEIQRLYEIWREKTFLPEKPELEGFFLRIRKKVNPTKGKQQAYVKYGLQHREDFHYTELTVDIVITFPSIRERFAEVFRDYRFYPNTHVMLYAVLFHEPDPEYWSYAEAEPIGKHGGTLPPPSSPLPPVVPDDVHIKNFGAKHHRYINEWIILKKVFQHPEQLASSLRTFINMFSGFIVSPYSRAAAPLFKVFFPEKFDAKGEGRFFFQLWALIRFSETYRCLVLCVEPDKNFKEKIIESPRGSLREDTPAYCVKFYMFDYQMPENQGIVGTNRKFNIELFLLQDANNILQEQKPTFEECGLTENEVADYVQEYTIMHMEGTQLISDPSQFGHS